MDSTAPRIVDLPIHMFKEDTDEIYGRPPRRRHKSTPVSPVAKRYQRWIRTQMMLDELRRVIYTSGEEATDTEIDLDHSDFDVPFIEQKPTAWERLQKNPLLLNVFLHRNEDHLLAELQREAGRSRGGSTQGRGDHLSRHFLEAMRKRQAAVVKRVLRQWRGELGQETASWLSTIEGHMKTFVLESLKDPQGNELPEARSSSRQFHTLLWASSNGMISELSKAEALSALSFIPRATENQGAVGALGSGKYEAKVQQEVEDIFKAYPLAVLLWNLSPFERLLIHSMAAFYALRSHSRTTLHARRILIVQPPASRNVLSFLLSPLHTANDETAEDGTNMSKSLPKDEKSLIFETICGRNFHEALKNRSLARQHTWKTAIC